MYAVRPGRQQASHQSTHVTPSAWNGAPHLEAYGSISQVGALHASPDHADLGGDHVVDVGPHQLTTGQLNALADYVASPEVLAAMSSGAVERALELIAREPLAPEEAAELLEIFPNYKELSLQNGNHFGASDPALCDPSGSGGPTNRTEIGGWLGQAFARAAEAGRTQDAAGLDDALAQAAFGGHYVADAFSSGHLFNKADVMAAIAGGVTQAGPAAMTGLVAMASARIASEGREVLDGWRVVGGPLGFRPVTGADLMALMGAVLAFMPEVFHNGVVLAIHDQLSMEGVDVTDGAVTWRMFGDHNLDAVSEARCSSLLEDVYAAVHGAFVRPDSVPSVDPFLARLPVPTGDEHARVRGVIERSSTVAGGGMETAVVAGSLAQLDTILSEATLLGLVPFARVGTGARTPAGHTPPTSDHADAHDFSDVVGPWAGTPVLA